MEIFALEIFLWRMHDEFIDKQALVAVGFQKNLWQKRGKIPPSKENSSVYWKDIPASSSFCFVTNLEGNKGGGLLIQIESCSSLPCQAFGFCISLAVTRPVSPPIFLIFILLSSSILQYAKYGLFHLLYTHMYIYISSSSFFILFSKKYLQKNR